MHRALRRSVFMLSSVCLAMAVPAVASADAVSFVQKELLHCIHPTVKADKAQVEIDKPTMTEGDTSTTRVRVFYEGAVKKNTMVVEVMEKAGKPPLVKVKVLEDTGTGHSPKCKYTKEGWQERKP
jgi:hypothetical protein